MKIVPRESKKLRKIARPIFGGVSVSVAASLFILPVSVVYFEGVSIIAPLTNLLVMLPSNFCMILGGLLTPLARLAPVSFLANAAAFVSGLLAKYMIWVADTLTRVPFSYVGLYENYIRIWLAGALILFALGLLFFRQKPKKLLFAGALCFAVLMAGVVSFEAANLNTTKITVLDVGNGSAVLVTKNKKAALIGCGGDYFAAGMITRELKRLRIESLELLFIPRGAATESGAAADVLSAAGTRMKSVKTVLAAEKSAETALLELRCGMTYAGAFSGEIWDGLRLSCTDEEDACAAYLDVGGTTALLLFSPGTDTAKLPPEWLNADILFCRAAVPERLDGEKYGLTVISSPNVKGAVFADEINRLGGRAYSTSAHGNVVIRTVGGSVCRVD